MNNIKFARLVAGVAILFFLVSCASTQLTSVWISPDGVNKIDSILVVGVSDNEHRRLVFEDTFVAGLQKAGLAASSGYQVLDATDDPNPTRVIEKISSLDVEAVLVTHLLGVDEETVYHPPTIQTVPYRYGSFGGYYGSVYGYAQQPGYTSNHVVVRLETNLYDRASQNILWSAQSETIDPKSIETLINELSSEVIKGLQKAGFL